MAHVPRRGRRIQKVDHVAKHVDRQESKGRPARQARRTAQKKVKVRGHQKILDDVSEVSKARKKIEDRVRMPSPPFVRREAARGCFNPKEAQIKVIRLSDMNRAAQAWRDKTHAIVNHAGQNKRQHEPIERSYARPGVIERQERHAHHEMIESQPADRMQCEPVGDCRYDWPKLVKRT